MSSSSPRRRKVKMMPKGIQLIAYLNFVGSTISLLLVLFGACLVYHLVKIPFQLPAPIAHTVQSSLAFVRTGVVPRQDAFEVFSLLGGLLWGVVGKPFVSFRLLAGSRFGYWLCILEYLVHIGFVGYAYYEQRDPQLLSSISVPALILIYLSLPKVRKIYA